jgi:DNA-binding LytR/AlgR family response regulator
MEKPHILIVEDEWIIYDELAAFLSAKGYSIAPYTKNYSDALGQLKSQLPDMVLLDIDLDGNKDGIDLGEKLFKNYHIPFIYLSAFTDKLTLNRARRTNPETFLIKAKPEIDLEQLAVSIQMALNKKNIANEEEKEGILVYSNYYRDATNEDLNKVRKAIIKFRDVLWIETDTKKRNYLVLHTADSKGYYKNSLSAMKQMLPFYFARVSSSIIVNLKQMTGTINHSYFNIGDEKFKIGKNFTEEVHKVLHCLYAE